MQHASKGIVNSKLEAMMDIARATRFLEEQNKKQGTVADSLMAKGKQAIGEGQSAVEGGINSLVPQIAPGMAVAAAQQMQQAQQGPGGPPPGMEGPPPGMEGPPVAGPPQMPPPPGMAGGGIAALRADNMSHFKEGGVLGFTGIEEQGSKVPGPDEMAQGEYDAEGKGLTKRDIDRMAAQLAVPGAMVRDIVSLPFNATAKYLLPESTDPTRTGKNVELMPSTNRQHRVIMANQPDRAAPVAEDAEIAKAYQDPSRQREGDTAATAYQDQSRAKDVLQKVGIATPRPQPSVVRPSPGPVAGPNAPAAPEPSIMDMFTSMMKAGRDNAAPTPDIDEARAKNREIDRLRAAQPLPGIEGLAAYRKAQAEEDRDNAELRSTEGSRALRAFTRGLETRDPNAVGLQMEGFTNERAAARKSTENRAQLTSALIDLQNAKAVGDAEKSAAAMEKIATLTSKEREINAGLTGHGMSMAASLGSAQIHAKAQIEAERMRNLSAEKLAAISRGHAETLHKLPNFEQTEVKRLVAEQVRNGIPEFAAYEAVYKAMGKGNYAAGESAAEKAYANRRQAYKDFADQHPQMITEKDPVKIAEFNRQREAYADALGGAGAGATPAPRTPQEQAYFDTYLKGK